jgi:hypothetical protein
MTLKFISLMDQKAIVLDLYMRAMWLDAIHEDLMRVRVRVLGEKAVAYSTVTIYVRSEKFPPNNDGPPSQSTTVEPGPVDQAILTALADYPFSSMREFSRLTCHPRSTVHGLRCTGTRLTHFISGFNICDGSPIC